MATTKTPNTWKSVVVLLLALLLTLSVASASESKDTSPVCTGKRLIVLAGPRRSATTSVAEFFFKWARGGRPDHSQGRQYHPLSSFRWPLVYGDASNNTEVEMPYKRFNHLVTDPTNEPLRKEILEAIKRDWEINGVNTVIFGGEEFDQVGASAPVGQDAIQAVRSVVQFVGAAEECVTIVVNYRDERFEHWVSLYSSLTQDASEPTKFLPYEQHMCEEKSSELRLQELGTSMNPMYISETYLKAGKWNVQMIDMGGVKNLGTDISHTIACSVMGGICDDDGWVKGHLDEVITNKVLSRDFKSLPKEEIVLSEKLFRYRDCAYEEELRNNEQFSVVSNQTVWADCTHDMDHEWVYQSFRGPRVGTRLVFDGLLSQVDCSDYGGRKSSQSKSEEIQAAKIEDFLSGTYQANHNIFEELEEDIEAGSFSVPLILVVVLFASGATFLAMKAKDSGGYTIAQFEMGEVSRSSGGRKKKNRGYMDDESDSSSSGEYSDDSDDDDETPVTGGFQDEYHGKAPKSKKNVGAAAAASTNIASSFRDDANLDESDII